MRGRQLLRVGTNFAIRCLLLALPASAPLASTCQSVARLDRMNTCGLMNDATLRRARFGALSGRCQGAFGSLHSMHANSSPTDGPPPNNDKQRQTGADNFDVAFAHR
jgi:hypothetical protein